MKRFFKKYWKYILVGVICLGIGANSGPSQDQLDKANGKVKSLSTKVASLQKENNDLSAKVKEAQPWFDLSKEQQDNQKKEADAKAAALAKQEADQKAAEQKAADDKAKADAAAALAARQKTLGAGHYVVGRDIPVGLYDTKATSGDGNFIVDDGSKVNEMFGVGGGFYNGSFNNVDLQNGDTIDINNDLHVQFIPK